MTELRKRGGGGGDPDSTDNISDKVHDTRTRRENRDTSPSEQVGQVVVAGQLAELVSWVARLAGELT